QSTAPCRTKANVNGVEREPGETTACVNPQRTSVSTRTLHQRLLVLLKSSFTRRSRKTRRAGKADPEVSRGWTGWTSRTLWTSWTAELAARGKVATTAFDVRRSALAEGPLLPAGHQGVEQGSELQVGFVELLFRIRSRHDAGSCVDTGGRAADQRGAYANNKFAAAACIQPAHRAGRS